MTISLKNTRCIFFACSLVSGSVTDNGRCNCVPAEKEHPYRYEAKHDTAFSKYAERKSFITTEDVRKWEMQYSYAESFTGKESERMENTPEDTLYNFKGWLYEVKTTEDDCDLHLQAGPEDPSQPRIVLEIPKEECEMQQELLFALQRRGFLINLQNKKGIYFEAKGLGFYDGHKKMKLDNKHEAGNSWEVHPVKEIALK